MVILITAVKSGPGTDDVLKRLAQIEKDYFAPMIFGVFVNKHVMIKVRRLQKRDIIDSIFLTKPVKKGEPLEDIQLEMDDDGKFISETLIVETHNSTKLNFKLNRINMEIVDKFNKPLQIVTEENTFGVIRVPSVLLDGKPPPSKFRIPFPAYREIAAPGNALKLEVTYSFNGEDKIHSPQPIKYTAVIDSIYVSSFNSPKQQAKELNLDFSEDTYRANLVIQSESHNKKAFKIEKLTGHVQYKDERKLIDVAVPKMVERLGEPFTIKVPKHGHLEWHGNKVVLDIDYKYNDETKSETIEIPFNLIGGGSGFPRWVIWVFLIPVFGILAYLLISHIVRRQPFVYHIALCEVSGAGTPLGDEAYFILENKKTLEFGPRGPQELRFDVGSEAFLYCDKKDLLLFVNEHDEEGQILEIPDTLTLSRGEEEGVIHVALKIADDAHDETEEEDEPYESETSKVNPIDV